MTASDHLSDSIDAVLERFERYLRAAAHRYRIDEADLSELAQDVRIRLWRAHEAEASTLASSEMAVAPERETIRTLPASYVVKAITSAALDLVRRRRAHRARDTISMPDVSSESSLSVKAEGPFNVETAELTAAVGRCLGKMLPSRRVVVQLHLHGHDRADIARLLGWSEAKVRNLTYRGLADLREALQGAGVSTEQHDE